MVAIKAGAEKPPWRIAFATVTLMQMVASFLTLCLPICGPALTSHFHLAPQRVGLIGGTIWAGSLAFVFAGGLIGRIGCGWIADRSRNVGRNLAFQAMGDSLVMLMLAALPISAPLAILLPVTALTGIIALGWNGVFLSEAARLAPDGAIAETTTGAVSVIYLANMLAPISGDVIVSVAHSWRLAFLLAAAVPAVLAILVIRKPTLGPRTRS